MDDADQMRDRLRELGRTGQPPASPQLEARLVERMRALGPGVVRRSRWRRRSLRAGALAVPLALVAWLGWRNGPHAEPAEAASRADAPLATGPAASRTREQPPAPIESVRAAPVIARAACAEHASPEATFSALAGDRRLLDLGARGRVVLEPATDAVLDASDPCQLELQLTSGRLSVHAANLFGGTLSVKAGTVEVTVHGTTFAVERVSDHVAVDLDEGAVEVAHAGQREPLLVAGQSWRISATQAPVLLALSGESRLRLRAALGAMPVATTATASTARGRASRTTPSTVAATLVTRADALWANGSRDAARARYREAGEAVGPTAEAAWLSLARRELSVGHSNAARDALARYAARFPNGELAAEAAGIEFRAALFDHDRARADRAARTLSQRYRDTPQGQAAARWQKEQTAQP